MEHTTLYPVEQRSEDSAQRTIIQNLEIECEINQPVNADSDVPDSAKPSEPLFAVGARQPWRNSKIWHMLRLQAELLAGSYTWALIPRARGTLVEEGAGE
eukprot:5221529-Amphidinium_carterae.2